GLDGVSLREAVAAANNTPGFDAITFADSLFGAARTITLTNGALTLTDPLGTAVAGPGASLLAVDGNDATQVFLINSGASAGLSGLTISGGFFIGDGSGIINKGTLTL